MGDVGPPGETGAVGLPGEDGSLGLMGVAGKQGENGGMVSKMLPCNMFVLGYLFSITQ